jgi:hypothetical protein
VNVAGIGPPPKDAARRARRNADPIPHTVLRSEQAAQPDLPPAPDWLEVWPERTVAWWAMWGASPQAEHFSSTDWDYLLDTAVLHAQVWGSGSVSHLTELRLRVAKFGATMEDRARLRMQFAQADEADAKRPAAPAARERYADLKVVDVAAAS